MRVLLGALGGLVVVALLALGADYLVTTRAEDTASQRVGAALGADARVDLQGFPVSVRLLRGTVPGAILRADDVPLEQGVTLDRLEVVLSDVFVTFAALTGDDPLPVRARTGRFTAELDAAALDGLVQDAPGVTAVELGDSTAALVTRRGQVDAAIGARDGALVLRATEDVAGEEEVVLRLDGLPGGAEVEGARVTDGVLLLTGSVADLVLPTAEVP